MMLRTLALGSVALGALAGLLSGVAPAAAGGCGYYYGYGCKIIAPLPYPHRHYHYLFHSPDHNYAPMLIADGNGGGFYGQWYWAGRAWSYVRPNVGYGW